MWSFAWISTPYVSNMDQIYQFKIIPITIAVTAMAAAILATLSPAAKSTGITIKAVTYPILPA